MLYVAKTDIQEAAVFLLLAEPPKTKGNPQATTPFLTNALGIPLSL